MVEFNHAVADITTSAIIKGGHGVIVSVHVTKAGASGDKVIFKNGGSSGATEFTVYGENIQNIQSINRRFEDGIYATVTGTTARYLIVYK